MCCEFYEGSGLGGVGVGSGSGPVNPWSIRSLGKGVRHRIKRGQGTRLEVLTAWKSCRLTYTFPLKQRISSYRFPEVLHTQQHIYLDTSVEVLFSSPLMHSPSQVSDASVLHAAPNVLHSIVKEDGASL